MKNLKAILKHGLALQESSNAGSEASSNSEIRFIERVKEEAEKHRLAFPLLIVLEGLRPLSTIAASALIALEPFADLFVPKKAYGKLISFLENRENLDQLISKLES